MTATDFDNMLSEKEFKDLAHLARLDPNDKGLEGLREDFNKILGFVEQIQNLDLSAAADELTDSDARNVMRGDDTGQGLDPRTLASVAPEWESGYFVVPRVIDAE